MPLKFEITLAVLKSVSWISTRETLPTLYQRLLRSSKRQKAWKVIFSDSYIQYVDEVQIITMYGGHL